MIWSGESGIPNFNAGSCSWAWGCAWDGSSKKYIYVMYARGCHRVFASAGGCEMTFITDIITGSTALPFTQLIRLLRPVFSNAQPHGANLAPSPNSALPWRPEDSQRQFTCCRIPRDLHWDFGLQVLCFPGRCQPNSDERMKINQHEIERSHGKHRDFVTCELYVLSCLGHWSKN